jgi:hypothetical protein
MLTSVARCQHNPAFLTRLHKSVCVGGHYLSLPARKLGSEPQHRFDTNNLLPRSVPSDLPLLSNGFDRRILDCNRLLVKLQVHMCYHLRLYFWKLLPSNSP